MIKPSIFCLLTALSMSCASSTMPSSAPVSTRHDVLALLEAAEAAHHCAGEDVTDEARAAELTACVEDNKLKARTLLPGVMAAGSMQPSTLAIVRLFIDENAAAEHDALCAQVPATDVMEGLLDDEARAICGK